MNTSKEMFGLSKPTKSNIPISNLVVNSNQKKSIQNLLRQKQNITNKIIKLSDEKKNLLNRQTKLYEEQSKIINTAVMLNGVNLKSIVKNQEPIGQTNGQLNNKSNGQSNSSSNGPQNSQNGGNLQNELNNIIEKKIAINEKIKPLEENLAQLNVKLTSAQGGLFDKNTNKILQNQQNQQIQDVNNKEIIQNSKNQTFMEKIKSFFKSDFFIFMKYYLYFIILFAIIFYITIRINNNTKNSMIIIETKIFFYVSVIVLFLIINDILETALSHVVEESVKENKAFEDLFNGLKMSVAEMKVKFEKFGIEQINPINQKFGKREIEFLKMIKIYQLKVYKIMIKH
jgi:molecular chaperone GrpE (heat shock protein)